jgi:TusE/DsrC/DsvC family sulfur relay protein
MGTIDVNGKTFEVDEEGYLVNLSDWNEDLAGEIAKAEKIDMTPNHWEVVNFLREYYNEYQIAPAVRVLTKAIGKKLGPEKGSNSYLYELFPYGPAKQACKIAGLPKPTGCV